MMQGEGTFSPYPNIPTILSILCSNPILAKLLMLPKSAYSVTVISVVVAVISLNATIVLMSLS